MAHGQKLGRYTLIEQLAVGGMAEIWLAHLAGPEGFEKLLVIKKIKPHLAKERSFVAMFLNEARLAAQLNHAHIVQIFDMGMIEQTYFIAMEYIRGRDLSEISLKAQTQKIPFPIEYAIKIIIQSCEGLYYAHEKTDNLGQPLRIVHRDISPQNLIVSFDGNLKILDFGIAKASNRLEQTQEGTLKGKVSYMSPEQIFGDEIDCRSDIFSLGIVFYELVTGFRLFSGDNELAILKSITQGSIYPPSYFKSDLPRELEPIILKALAKDPEKRYQNAWEMQCDLNALLSRFAFNPSPIHLSNFLKQLFAEEIKREQQYLEKKIKHVLYAMQHQANTSPASPVPSASPVSSSSPASLLSAPPPTPLPSAALSTLKPLNAPLPSVHAPSPPMNPSYAKAPSVDTDPDLAAFATTHDDEAASVELLPSFSSNDSDERTFGKDSDIAEQVAFFRTHNDSESLPDEGFEEDLYPEGVTALAPAPFHALPSESEVLCTLRFPSSEYKALKRLADQQQLPLEQFLYRLIQQALPLPSPPLPQLSTHGKKY